MKPRCLRSSHPDFPDCLRHIPDPPAAIYVLGDLKAILAVPRLAVVGSRKVTAYGKQVTSQLAGQAASQGIAIISGLAYGVDALAHQAALDAHGLTLAVLGTSLDQITPASNQRLAQDILAQGGALISEYPPGAEIFKLNFVERNRLVAGLADAVLITEAAVKSGSRHTAVFAMDQGKTVMAVPGNITSPMSEGTNELIKTGGLVVTHIKDILLAMDLKDASSAKVTVTSRVPAENTILQLLQSGVQGSSDLLAQSGLTASVFNQTLSMLEITGLICPLGNGQWAIK